MRFSKLTLPLSYGSMAGGLTLQGLLKEGKMDFILSTSSMGNPQLLFFATLTMTIASCWFTPRWVSYLGYGLSCGLAYWYHYIDGLGFIWLFLIAFMFSTYYKANSIPKLALGLLLAALIVSIYLHFVPGFHNFMIANKINVSPNSSPYSSYVNVDKVLVGSIVLLFYSSLNRSLQEWKASMRILPLPLLAVCALLLGTAFAMRYISIDLKIPSVLWWWIPTNLLLVCVMEEVFYRGFVQKELTKAFSSYKGGNWFAVVLAAIVFGASHYTGGIPYIILSTFAGIVYGYVFMRSHRLESSILLHFLVNLIHILAFSYPSLMRG
jgi:membrane protease YdiL (CAAX protease family)